jgi:hypothetical protein
MKLDEFELARAEKLAFNAQVEVWAEKYALSLTGIDESSAYTKLLVRLIAVRCCMNNITEHSNIEKVIDKFILGDLSVVAQARLLQILRNPLTTQSAKMAEISKQFYGEKPTSAPGFAMWKVP